MIRQVLPNGLRVLVHEHRASPLASIALWLEAGVVDERPEEAGAAHFLEHMLFKGTARRGVGVAAAEIEGLGGDLNAWTSYDETVIDATVEAVEWDRALDVVADMVMHSAIDAAEHERERQVVLEEIRGYDDDPDTILEEATLARIYPGHPYGRPILGTAAQVRSLTTEALRGYRDRCHGADRAILAVVGDVDAEAVLRAASRLLGGWRASGAPRALSPAPEPPPGGVTVFDRRFETPAVELAWRACPIGHPDAPALEVLASALGDGAASLLTTRLQLEDPLASDVWSNTAFRIGSGSVSFGFVPRQGKTPAAIEAALDEIAQVARRGISGTWVVRARDAILADLLFGSETVDGIAHDLCWFESHHGDPEARRRWRDAIAAVSPEDVRRVARTWLEPRHAHVVVLDPNAKRPRVDKAVAKVVEAPPPKRPDGPVRTVFDNGATLWVLPDDGPVAAAHVVGLGGGLAETAKTAGTANAWARMVVAGAADFDATAFAEAMDDVAGTIDGFAGHSTMGLRATFPAAWARDGLDLLGAALVEPMFDDEEWERVREELIDEVRTLPDYPEAMAREVVWARMWPGHPWGLPEQGSEATLKAIKTSRLKRFHGELVTAENTIVVVAGGVEPDEVVETLRPWLEDLPKGPAAIPRRVVPEPSAGAHRARAGHEQAHVSFAIRGGALADPDRLPLQILAAALDGQGGRLFLPLREERGLAYSVWAVPWSGWDGGMLTIGLSCDPGRVAEARDALDAELRRLADEPLTADEVARYRRMVTGQVAMGLQRASGRAEDLATGERLGLPWGYGRHKAALLRIDADRVAETTRRLLSRPILRVTVEPR